MHDLINATLCTHIFHPSLRYISKLNSIFLIWIKFWIFFFLTLSNSTNLQPLFKGWIQCVYWKYKYETFLDINVTFTQVENAWNISYHVKLYVNVSTWVLGLQTNILEISWDAFYLDKHLLWILNYFTSFFLLWIYYRMIVCVLNNKYTVEDWVSYFIKWTKGLNLV